MYLFREPRRPTRQFPHVRHLRAEGAAFGLSGFSFGGGLSGFSFGGGLSGFSFGGGLSGSGFKVLHVRGQNAAVRVDALEVQAGAGQRGLWGRAGDGGEDALRHVPTCSGNRI